KRLSDTEIQHAHLAAAIDPDILWLDVTVHDPVKILAADCDLQTVRVLQRTRDRNRHLGGEPDGQRSAAHQLGKALSIDVFHGDASELVEDLVLSDLTAGGRDHSGFPANERSLSGELRSPGQARRPTQQWIICAPSAWAAAP